MFIIDDFRKVETAEEVAQYIIDNMTEEYYDDMLDECYPAIEICGYEYAPSIALFRVDEVAYRCGMVDYYDSLYSDILRDIERMTDGDNEDFYGFSVDCEEEE